MADLALDKKALNLVVLDVRGRSGYADFLVIASGTSDRHVQSIGESVLSTVSKNNTSAIGHEGLREGQWALVDFGSVVLHVFHEYTRSVYRIEELWQDVPRLKVNVSAPARQSV